MLFFPFPGGGNLVWASSPCNRFYWQLCFCSNTVFVSSVHRVWADGKRWGWISSYEDIFDKFSKNIHIMAFPFPTNNILKIEVPFFYQFPWRCLVFCQTPRASAIMELTLFSPCHKKKNKKNPHQNLPEVSEIQVWNLAHGLNLMEDNFCALLEETLWGKPIFDEDWRLVENSTF